jgi:hypothetical protein
MNRTSKIISAFAIGSAAGAVLGLLLAADKKANLKNENKEGSKIFSNDIRGSFFKEKMKKGEEDMVSAK